MLEILEAGHVKPAYRDNYKCRELFFTFINPNPYYRNTVKVEKSGNCGKLVDALAGFPPH